MDGWVQGPCASPSTIDYNASICMIEAIGSKDSRKFAQSVLSVARDHVRVQHCSVFAFQRHRSPELISAASLTGTDIARDTASPYIRQFFRKDEIQDIIVRRAGAAPNSLIVTHHQSQDDISDPEYRLACYSGVNITARIANLIRVRHDVWISVNLYRDAYDGSFSSADIDTLRNLSPLFAHAAARHYALDVDGRASARNFVSDKLASLDVDLTVREREVILRILDGQTTKIIAKGLAISPSTVVTYRERAYEKLGIRSRTELFSSFLRRNGAAPHR